MIEEFSGNIGVLPNFALQIAKQSMTRTEYLLLQDPAAENESTNSSLLLAAQAGSAFFAAANTDEEEFNYVVGSQLSIKSIRPTSNHDPANWLNALWASVICRARHLVDDLCQFPVETLRSAGGTFDEYMYAWVEALQTYFRGEDELYPKINRSIELTDPDSLQHATPEIALYRYYPTMKLLFNLAAGKAEQFNADLQESVELHQSFWTANHERSIKPEGFFALGPTALAAVAHDTGMAVGYQSDYLPKHFIDGAGMPRTAD
ncbi:immunity 49 family protein [Saccharopolyspora hirsuta]|uniref:immunity 49 family protein n=1 Tax=Saccharopolyspora hirsuta TaxID=1837 RepID=UPI001478EB1D|nr:immunity 49 family protein [Saccharopolyspora hirsuta]